jgi:arylsulfatase A-like enzyme
MYSDYESPQVPRQPGKVTDRAGMRKLIDGYDTGIRYADDQVGVMVDLLKRAGVYEDTVIIISSDHGENFGELGIYAEHATADEITCRIPFIVKWPGTGASGAVANGFHYNLDWGPTLMELLKAPTSCKPAVWQGQSFASTILTGQDTGRDQLILSQCAHVCQRSVRWDNWLYMRTYHCGYHDFPAEMLFDLADDPHEQDNLASQRPDICHQGAWRLTNWMAEQMDYMAKHTTNIADPLWTVMSEGGPFHAPEGVLPSYLKRLEATGRSEAAARLRAKYCS